MSEMKAKKKKNIVVRILSITAVLILLLLLGALTFIDQIARTGIETAGSLALGTSATLEKADIQILKGQVVLENFKIANPKGYQTPEMMELAMASSAVEIGSLMGDTVVVDHVIIDGLTLTIEQKGLTTNVQEILDGISEKSEAGEDKTDEKAEPEEASGKKLKINRIEIRNAGTRIKLVQGLGGADKGMVETHLGDIVLTDIGGDKSNTVMASEVIREILVAMTKATISKNPKDIPANLLNNLAGSVKLVEISLGKVTKDVVEGAGKVSKEVVKGAGKALEKGAEGVKGAVDTILKAPGGLLGGSKSDDEKK